MDISGYLRRINYNGIVYRDLASLRELQYNHVFSIPFETLDIHNQVPILLQINFLYQKVIHDNRGGYCYELNVLFHNLLTHCGFDVRMIGGRLHHGNGKFGREFEHMALIVELKGRQWLVDVGYGDFSLMPLAIMPGEIQSDGRNFYQVIDPVVVDGRSYLGVAKWNASKQDFKLDYVFTLTPRVLEDFYSMNEYHQTSPDSHFRRSVICTLPTKDGRISMINNKLIRTENGKRQVRIIQSDDQRDEILEKYFHMDMVYLL
ncbi:MAG TPA: arylamine N-acetyltransferase [Puia sp.]|uniref:arylamine N-acetyltransferase family protein n=1 Tax=Puia sp. TaxID=2045100 RepID=UPI002C9DC157|nr:arylamine N-acetyltransferase [Puia sp.]HVU95801.1 arylamine N-acetyltransferase [Puia sp.]